MPQSSFKPLTESYSSLRIDRAKLKRLNGLLRRNNQKLAIKLKVLEEQNRYSQKDVNAKTRKVEQKNRELVRQNVNLHKQVRQLKAQVRAKNEA